MSRVLRSLAFLTLLISVGCDSSESYDITDYEGVYTGVRSIIDDGTTDTESITFTISADKAAGTVALVLQPEFGGPERIDGTYDDNGIRVRVSQAGATIRFDADTGGDIRGTYAAFDQEGTVTGRLTPSQFDLTFAPLDASGTRTEIRTSR